VARFDFVLAGGTGLALQLGHRISLDFDLFIATGKFPRLLKEQLAPAATFVGAPIPWDSVKAFFQANARELVQHMISATR
jgi:hypothetical protein